jgi:Ca-activated chloride channel family protein
MWSLAAPWAFLLLPLPFLAAYLLRPRALASGALRLPETIAASLPASPMPLIGDRTRSILSWSIWALLVVALAGPRLTAESPALPSSGRDIVLALDLSGSMEKSDFELDGQPAKRIDVVKRTAARFVRGREGDRVGLVVFAEKAYYAAAPTFDVEAVARAIEEAKIGISGKSTAISEGLGLALKRLARSQAASRVVILLSDGINNGGSVKPNDAATLARQLGIRVHTIAMGRRDLESDRQDPDVVDTAALSGIAAASGGETFRVRTAADLDAVAASIDALETSRIEVPVALVHKDYWMWPALVAFAGIVMLAMPGRRQ